MERRLNREDITSSNPLFIASQRRHGFTWFVYKRYELVDQEWGEEYFEAISVPKDQHELDARRNKPDKTYSDLYSKRWVSVGDFGAWYAPLTDTPHLFLGFARLYDNKNPKEAILEWVSKYGLLGLQRRQPYKFDIVAAEGVPHKGMIPEYSQRGGPEELLDRVLLEAQQANWILAAYETVLSKNVEKLEQLHCRIRHADSTAVTYTDALIDGVMLDIIDTVQEALKAYTFPSISHLSTYSEKQPESRLWAPDQLIRSLYPKNLLGAMYLQFYWLITSAAELARCKYCDRIIPYAKPMPGTGRTRKIHKNKEFCDDRCRQNYHYHNRIKPKRQGT